MILTCDHKQQIRRTLVPFAAGDRSMARRRCQPRHLRHGNSGIQRPLLTSPTSVSRPDRSCAPTIMTLSCGTTRNDMRTDINGERCRAEINSMAICTDRRPHRQLFGGAPSHNPLPQPPPLSKYALDDCLCAGRIRRIDTRRSPRAPYTEAYQATATYSPRRRHECTHARSSKSTTATGELLTRGGHRSARQGRLSSTCAPA